MTPTRLPWRGTLVIVALAVVALVIAHLVHEPDRIDPDDYARWRSYCIAEGDRNEVRGTRAWTAYVNDCMVDIATADARMDR